MFILFHSVTPLLNMNFLSYYHNSLILERIPFSMIKNNGLVGIDDKLPFSHLNMVLFLFFVQKNWSFD